MRCVIVEKNEGIFFRIMDLNDGKPPILLFTKDHESKYVVDRIPLFKNVLEAESFLKKYLVGSGDYMIIPLEKDTKDTLYANYRELIENGLSEHVGYMIDSLYYPSLSKH